MEHVIDLVDEHASTLRAGGQHALAEQEAQIADWLRELRSARIRIEELTRECTRCAIAAKTALYERPDREGELTALPSQ